MQLIAFEWQWCLDGYQFVPRPPGTRIRSAQRTGKTLIKLPVWTVEGAPEGSIRSAGTHHEVYSPTAFPALFQCFADAPATVGGMLDFANRFGLLEGGSPRSGTLTDQGAWLGGMLAHHAALRAAVDLLEANDFSRLEERYNHIQAAMEDSLISQVIRTGLTFSRLIYIDFI
jgi:hypothetical protein